MGARDPPGDPTGGPAPCGLKNRRFRARFLRLFYLVRKHMFYFFDVSTSDFG